MFHFSDTWQLIINTGTTIVTLLMVFLIQNTQNRDAKAVHLKLGEIIRALKKARNELVDLEELADEELGRLEVSSDVYARKRRITELICVTSSLKCLNVTANSSLVRFPSDTGS